MQLAHIYRRLTKKYDFEIICFQSRSVNANSKDFYSYGEGSKKLSKDFKLDQPYGKNLFLKLNSTLNIDEYEEHFKSKSYSYIILEYFLEDKPYHKVTRTSVKDSLSLTSFEIENEIKTQKLQKIEGSLSPKINKTSDLFPSSILKGIHPITNEVLPKGHAWLHPEIISDIKEHIKNEIKIQNIRKIDNEDDLEGFFKIEEYADSNFNNMDTSQFIWLQKNINNIRDENLKNNRLLNKGMPITSIERNRYKFLKEKKLLNYHELKKYFQRALPRNDFDNIVANTNKPQTQTKKNGILVTIKNDIKKNYDIDLVLIQNGAFFETVDEDAQFLTDKLGIKRMGNRKFACGFPLSAINKNQKKLIELKIKFCIVEQIKDTNYEKGFIRQITLSTDTQAIGEEF